MSLARNLRGWRSLALVACAAMLVVGSANAGTLYWSYPSGTWGTTSTAGELHWSSASGTAGTSTWTNNYDAVFETNASTVAVSSTATPTVHNVTFNVSGCLIGGSASGNLQLTSGSTSTFNVNGGTATVSAVLAGSGSNLTKTGTGLLVLSGSNTYTGSTTVGSGTLQLGDGTNDGSVAGNITNNSALIFNNHADQTVAGAISGSGVLTKNNTGVLTLSRTNYYTGNTMINAGVIKVRNTSALGTSAGSTSVARGAALYLYTSGGTYSENLNLAGYGLSKNAGALTNYSGDNTWAGTIHVDDAGQYTVIRSYVGTLTITGSITLADYGDWSDTSGQLTFADNQSGTTSSSVVVSGNISGGVADQWSISKLSTGTNPGTLTLSGNNTYAGCTEIRTGTLRVEGGLAIPDQSVVAMDKHADYGYTATFEVANSETIGSLMSGNNATTCNGTVLINSGATLSTGAKNETVMRNSYVGLIAGEGGLTKVGTGRQILRNDNNTYGGGTTVSSGTLTALGTQTLGTGSVQVNGSTALLEIGSSLSGVGTVTLTNGTISSSNVAGTGTLTGTSYAVQQGVVGVSLGGAGGLTKTGDGTVALTCANSYSGKTVVNDGTLVAIQDSSLGAAPGSAVSDQLTLDGGTLRCSRGIADVTVTNQGDWYVGIYFPTATITGGGGSGASVLVSGSVKSATVYGTTSGGWTTIPTVYFDAPDMAGGVTATGTLSSTPTLVGGSITGSTVTNPNQNCGYTSAPAVLYLEGVNDEIPNAEVWGKTFKMQVEDVVLASGAGYGYTSTPTVTFSNGNATAAATLTSPSMTLAATRGITLGTGGGTIETDSGFNATVAGVISGNGALTKTGAGTLTMTASNTYAGATTVSAGTLQIGNGGTTGSLSSGTISIGSGANLTFNRSSSLIFGNVISGAGSLTKLNTNTLTLTGANSYTGATTVDAGILQIGAGATSGTIGSGALAVNSGATLKFNRSDAYTVDNAISGGGALIVAGGGTLTYTGASSLSGTTSISSSTLSSTTLQLGDGTVGGSCTSYAGTILIGSTSTLLFNNAAAQTFNGVIGGSTGTLAKDGAGQLTLGGASTYTGTARVLAGTLQIGAGSTSGSIGAGAFAVSSGATLKFNRRDAYTVDSAISGGGALVVTGGGTLTYTGASTLSGTTSISSSTLSSTTLQLGDGTTAGSCTYAGTILIGSTSTLLFNNAVTQTFNGVIGGSTGTLAKDGAGTLTLVGANTYTGTTRILDGKLQFGSGGSIGSVNGNIDNGGLLAFNYNGDQTYGYVISGNGGLKKYGTGMLTLTGSNTFTGTTTVSAGTLRLSGATGSINSSGGITLDGGALMQDSSVALTRAITFTSSGTLGGTGAYTRTGANVSIGSGHLSPGDGGIGTFTMNCGTLTLSSSSVLDYDFGTTAGSCDTLVVNGKLVLDGTLNISCSGSLPGGDYVILSATSIVDNGLVLGAHPDGHDYTIIVTSTTVTVHAAPEPGTIVLLMIGLVGLATYVWRKKKDETLRG